MLSEILEWWEYQHQAHTEENPDPVCPFCSREQWEKFHEEC